MEGVQGIIDAAIRAAKREGARCIKIAIAGAKLEVEYDTVPPVIESARMGNAQARGSVSTNEVDEASRFLKALVKHVCEWRNFEMPETLKWIFVRSDAANSNDARHVAWVWRQTICEDIDSHWIGRRIGVHIDSGRLPGLRQYRTSAQRGYMIDPDLIVQFLAQRAGKDSHTVVEEWSRACKTRHRSMTP
jgi:hypothetical protein